MSLKSSTNTAVNTYELIIEVGGEDFDKAVNTVYNKEKKDIQLKGFRKGKAPRKLVEKEFGENVFWENAINDLCNSEIPVAIEQEKLEIVDTPAVELVSASITDGVVLKVTCTTKPEITIENYKGILAEKPSEEVTDADVDAQLEQMQKRNARMISIDDRPAQLNDQVVIDFEGFQDGVAFEGGKAENFELGLGSHQFIPGFEDAIVGHNVGEEFDIDVTFPEDYGMESLAGKPATFKIKLHEITSQELPEFDDDFVKEISEFDTVDEYKADARTKLQVSMKNNSEAEFNNNVMQKVIDLVQGEIPECMFRQRVDRLVSDFEQRLKTQGMGLDMYLQYTGMDLDSFKETFKERAKDEVTLRLALEKIAELENVEVSDEEVDNYIKEIADANKVNVDMVKQFIGVENIRADLTVEKASNLVLENAVVQSPAEVPAE
ncbi:MAG: trigger factor [Ruminococcus sp.]|nr:trigger factor [Ruminococcus sp.]